MNYVLIHYNGMKEGVGGGGGGGKVYLCVVAAP